LQLKEALQIIRKIFPYRDTCIPCDLKLQQGETLLNPARFRLAGKCKPCFNRHLGLCPGVCLGEISKTEYRKIVRRITLLFRGKKMQLLKNLERDMKKLAREERFEEAVLLRRQVFALTHIHDVSLIKDEYRRLTSDVNQRGRIEAYDVAHLQGSSNVGVMTVVEEGVANKNEYRKFRIRLAKPGDDAGALREILFRRLAHDEWPLPRVIAVDGAKAQINAAEAVVKEYGMSIPVVGMVKDEKHRPKNILGDRGVIKGRERDILLANTEAHRFAIAYHRKRTRAELGI
jgi:excinuclease ABC subunit C